MAKKPYKDVTDKCKRMRKSVLMDICREELTEDEMEVFLLRIYKNYYRPRVATETGKCPETTSKLFMRAIHKLREIFGDKSNE